jgi:large subunit ribosomal protein L30
LLRARLRVKGQGNKKVDEKRLKERTGLDFEELANALLKGKALKEFENLKPVLRLRPPSKGFKSTRLPWPKGDLGYRGKEINELLRRMM